MKLLFNTKRMATTVVSNKMNVKVKGLCTQRKRRNSIGRGVEVPFRLRLGKLSDIRSHCSAVSDIDAATPSSSERSHLLNSVSSTITQPKSQGASQAMLLATGISEDDLNKPQIGISSVWYEGNPCNMHLLSLSEKCKQGVEESGCVGYRFNTIGVSDGISMGTKGMCYSLQSREIIADSIETVMGAQWYDGNISIPGCDKNMPGTVIAMGRVNRPSVMVYGGTIQPGKCGKTGNSLDIVSAFQSYGQFVAGKVTEEERAVRQRTSFWL